MKRCVSCECVFENVSWTCPSCGFSPGERGGKIAFAPEFADENDGMNASAHEALNELQAGNFWFRARNRLIQHLAKKHFLSAASILEVGCGTGYVLGGLREAFPESFLTGSEIYSVALDAAQASAGAPSEIFQMDARNIPFEEEFDLVCAFDVLEHIEEDVVALQHMFKATRVGGGVLASVPQHPFLWSPIDDLSHHKRRYRRGELEEKCRQVGYSVVETTSYVSALLPLLALQRLRLRNAGAIDPTAELKISGPLNKSLEAVLDAERMLIARGFSLPIGGSRFVVARKL